MEVEKIREALQKNIGHWEGLDLRNALNTIATKKYTPKYSDATYLMFLDRHTVHSIIVAPQDINCPYYMKLKTANNSVYGDCFKECMDKIIDIEG